MIAGPRQIQAFVFTLLSVVGTIANAMDKPDDLSSVAQAESRTFIGLVETVLSGDEIRMRLTSGETIEVTLAGITAPAEISPFAMVSRQWLSGQLKGQLVSAECLPSDTDRFDCAVFPDDRHINVVSLFHGYSVCSGGSSALHDADYYKQIEAVAKSNRFGVWQLLAGQ